MVCSDNNFNFYINNKPVDADEEQEQNTIDTDSDSAQSDSNIDDVDGGTKRSSTQKIYESSILFE